MEMVRDLFQKSSTPHPRTALLVSPSSSQTACSASSTGSCQQDGPPSDRPDTNRITALYTFEEQVDCPPFPVEAMQTFVTTLYKTLKLHAETETASVSWSSTTTSGQLDLLSSTMRIDVRVPSLDVGPAHLHVHVHVG